MVAQVDWLGLQLSCCLDYQRQKPAARCDRRERRRGGTPEKYRCQVVSFPKPHLRMMFRKTHIWEGAQPETKRLGKRLYLDVWEGKNLNMESSRDDDVMAELLPRGHHGGREEGSGLRVK